MTTLYRIRVIGTKGGARRYLATDASGEGVAIVKRADALHWNKKTASILVKAFNDEFERIGRPERFQIEKSLRG